MPGDRGATLLEICVDTPDGLASAIAGGADRIELCAALELGGLTPSPGLIAAARSAPVPVFAMVRPRAGDFVFGPRERDAMLADIAAMRAVGLAGVVLGASRRDGTLDAETLGVLSESARGLGLTLHRAFDLAPDQEAALETAVALGFHRILTSGAAPSALEGSHRIRELMAAAGERLAIMAGGGVRPDTVADLVAVTGVAEVHASARRAITQDPQVVRFGFATAQSFVTDGDTIRALRQALASRGDR